MEEIKHFQKLRNIPDEKVVIQYKISGPTMFCKNVAVDSQKDTVTELM